MISHPSEYWEGCDPNADTTSKASYAGMEAVAQAWERLFPVLEDAEEFGPDECNGSGRCSVTKHVHGCFSDLGRCDEPLEHGVAA